MNYLFNGKVKSNQTTGTVTMKQIEFLNAQQLIIGSFFSEL